METKDIELNLNNSHCLYERKTFTSTEVHNVCNGKVSSIPLGVDDVLTAILMIILISIVVFIGYISFSNKY